MRRSTQLLHRAALAAVTLFLATCSNDQTIGTDQLTGPLAAIGVDPVSGASIETNKDDYQPGEVVHVEGRGWAPNEMVVLFMIEEPNTHEDVTQEVQADGAGSFSIHFYDVQEHDLGVTFTLTATGQTSGSVAEAVFTDNISNIVMSGASPTPFSPNQASSTGVKDQAVITLDNPAGFANRISVRIRSGSSIPGPLVRTFPELNVGGNATAEFNWDGKNDGATFVSDGLYTARMTNSTGSSSSPTVTEHDTDDRKKTIVVDNTNPAIAIDAISDGAPGVEITITGTASDLPAIAEAGLEKIDVTVRRASDNAILASGEALNTGTNFSTWSFSYTPSETSAQRASAKATDNAANNATSADVSFTIAAANAPPTVDAGDPYTVAEGTQLTLAPTVTDPDGDALTYKWTINTSGIDPSGACTFEDDTVKNAKVTCTDDSQDATDDKFVLTLEVDDGQGHTVTDNADLTVTNADPTASAGGPYTGDEGSAVPLTGSKSDPGSNDTHTYQWSFAAQPGVDAGASCSFSPDETQLSPSITCTDDGSFKVTLTVTDDDGGSHSDDAYVTLINAPPVITSVSLSPTTDGFVYPVTGQPKVNAAWTDAGTNDSHTCTYDITDVVLNTVVSDDVACGSNMNAPGAGLFLVTVVVSDDDTGTDTENYPTGGALIVIYDPSAGFVTGGGWIDSPEGACQYGTCGPTTVGKATFGFVSKYLKGATVPTGNTEFQFHAGTLNFRSTTYDWLVVSQNGTRAQYKGYGSINGVSGYGFLLTALDEVQDKFRIKIWDTSSNQVVYDNRMGYDDTSSAATILGGGSIIIHVPKK